MISFLTSMELLIRPIGLSGSSRFICRSCRQHLRKQRRSYASTATKNPELYDVVCVGGGPAGLSLLTALRSNPTTAHLKTALIESQPLAPTRTWSLPPSTYSNRCSSLTPASVAFLEEIGAWPHIDASRLAPYEEMQVWDGITGSRISFDWPPSQGTSKTIAYMTENLNLTSGLLKRLDELSGTSIFENSKVERITLGEDTETHDLSSWPVLSLSSGKSIAARLLVGADGANSPVRSFAGIESRGWDYDRHGVVATLKLVSSEGRKTAYQRFLPSGPIALLPLPGPYATLVWSTTPSRAAFLKSLSHDNFVACVSAAFRLSTTDIDYLHNASSEDVDMQSEFSWRAQHSQFDESLIPPLAMAVQEGSIASFPLKMRHADTYIGERIALVGDAAHTIHPLAGQGLNQGQGDVQSLSKNIAYSVEHGMDLGVRMNLERYEGERYAANHLLLGVCDKLHKVYAVESGPLVGLRSIGLRAVDALGPLKGFFMERAAGNGAKLF